MAKVGKRDVVNVEIKNKLKLLSSFYILDFKLIDEPKKIRRIRDTEDRLFKLYRFNSKLSKIVLKALEKEGEDENN